MISFKINRILIPIDFSETSYLAKKHAAFMAKLFKAELYLLHVVEKSWEFSSVLFPEIKIDDQRDLLKKVDQKLKDEALNIANEYGIKVFHLSAVGNIHTEVTAACESNAIDIIIMGTHGASGFEEFFIGSNAYKVVTQSKCPVITVQTQATEIGFNDIVLPIDNSKHTLQKVAITIEMAKRYGSKLYVIGLLEEDADASEEKKFAIKLSKVASYIEKAEIPFKSEVVKGKNIATATLEYAQKIKAELIVIMTEQEEDITGFLIGPYAQQIVNHSKIPVMSITPNINTDLIESVHPY